MKATYAPLVLITGLIFASGCRSHSSAPVAASQLKAVASQPTQPAQPASPQSKNEEESAPQITKYDVDKPLALGQQIFHFVSHVLRLEHPGPRRQDRDDETVDYWEIRDSSGNSIFTIKTNGGAAPAVYDETFAETESAGAEVFHTQHGDGILVSGDFEPSAPHSGNWIQVFGLKDSKLKAFGSQLEANDFLGFGNDPQGADTLKFSEHVEYFNIFYFASINWSNGTLESSRHCLPLAQGAVRESCLYDIEIELGSPRQASIQLYSVAEEHGQPQPVQVRPESKVEFIQAQVPVKFARESIEPEPKFDDMWLRVRVDGKEGWVHSQEDFIALGLQPSG